MAADVGTHAMPYPQDTHQGIVIISTCNITSTINFKDDPVDRGPLAIKEMTNRLLEIPRFGNEGTSLRHF